MTIKDIPDQIYTEMVFYMSSYRMNGIVDFEDAILKFMEHVTSTKLPLERDVIIPRFTCFLTGIKYAYES